MTSSVAPAWYRTLPSGSTTTLRPTPVGAGALMDSTWIWLTMAFARASTSSTDRSEVVVSTGWMTASAPIQASCRNISGKAPSWQIARPIRPTSGMSKTTAASPGSDVSCGSQGKHLR